MAVTNTPLVSGLGPTSAPAPLTNDIRAIKPPVAIPTGWEWVWWTLGALAVAAVFVALFVYWRRRAAQPVFDPPVPAHVRAKQRLEEALRLIGDARLFCIAVSDALRGYLEERFLLRAPERTTEEFLLDIKQTAHLNESQKQGLAEFLEHCDLAKFARVEPTEEALRALHESALRLVDETKYEPIAV
jgi:hypothetical protein